MNEPYFNEEAIDFNSPDEIIMQMEEYIPQNDDRTRLVILIRDTVRFIMDNKCESDALLLGILYALSDPLILEQSTRKRARDMNIASGLISHYTKRFESEILYK